MYDPKFRFTIIVAILVTCYWVFDVANNYLFGEKGLNFDHYILGTITVGGAVIGGFIFVWICTKFITFQQFRKTGFEAAFEDESGTAFNFRLSLSKFLPEIIARPPLEGDLSPLEAELLGFLNGYNTWPYDLNNPEKSLRQHALEQWWAMKHLDGAGPMHRAAALAQDLGKVYAYQEKRKIYPLGQFWKRDDVSYQRRCSEHGGLSAFILSTMTSFKKLGKDEHTNQRDRRALLTAIRYCKDPTNMPANCDPMAREIYEYLNRAGLKAKAASGVDLSAFNPTDEEKAAFTKEIKEFMQAAIRDLAVNPSDISERSDGVYIGNGVILARMSRLTARFAAMLTPNSRTAFNLWEIHEGKHPSWPLLLEILEKQKVLTKTWEDVTSDTGLFDFKIESYAFPDTVILMLDGGEFPNLRQDFDQLPKWHGMAELQQSKDALLADLTRKSESVDEQLAQRFS